MYLNNYLELFRTLVDILIQTLRHVFHHGLHKYPGLHRRLDISPTMHTYVEDDGSGNAQPLKHVAASSRNMQIQRHRTPSLSGDLDESALGLPTAWTIDQILGPNITDKETVLGMARIASNAYKFDSGDIGWEDVGGGFNYTDDFGWEDDGLRGHIFIDADNSTVAIGIKGTSLALFDNAGSTRKDRINDNLFFGCCCGQESALYIAVCDCQTTTNTCNSTCLANSLKKQNYYHVAVDLFKNISALYPNSDIWLVGHSLGGTVSALVGLRYGLPVVTFQAPGHAMAAKRLGLPTPPMHEVGTYEGDPPGDGGFHFGHTADPLFTGSCTGYPCSWWGYAMQSKCHTGSVCVYNTTRDLGWGEHLINHKIETVIHQVIEVYNETAKCIPVRNCRDCGDWKYFESNSSDPKTKTSTTLGLTTSFIRTRTATCMTPGWFGCLDESSTSAASKMTTSQLTTTSSTTTSTTTTSSVTTCKSPGWFGCNDPTTSTSMSPRTSHKTNLPITTTSSITCHTPGWFRCNDPSITAQPALSASEALRDLPVLTTTILP